MKLSYVIATLHILTFGIGFYGIWARANALKRVKDVAGLDDVFKADNFWGLAALLWIITGVWRTFGGLEKGSDYYLHSTAFMVKMGLFIIVFLLEIKPMITLVKWRTQKRKGQLINFSGARQLALLSHIELGLVAIIVCLATAMARGMGY